jgi:hypothetical protein
MKVLATGASGQYAHHVVAPWSRRESTSAA